MIKHANIKGVIYDVIGIVEFEQNQILKIQRQADKKFFYFKVKSADDEIIGQVIEDEETISELDGMEFSMEEININKKNVDELNNFKTNYSNDFNTYSDDTNYNHGNEQPRDKEPSETISNYFKYLDNFYRN